MDIKAINALSIGNKKIIVKKPVSKEKIYAPRHEKGELFLCGPIPWDWVCIASKTGGKGCAVQVALAIWFLSGLNYKSATVKVTRKTLESLGIERNAGYRGLRSLENAGLVSVDRRPGSSPVVTILDAKEIT
mgnify:CR=1 FL=1